MNLFFIIIIIILIIGFSALFFIFSKKIGEIEKRTIKDQSNLMIQEQLDKIRENINSQQEQNLKIVENVTKKLGDLDATNKQVVNFADQLQNLQDILKNPKQRGVLGEFYLESVLKNVLPPGIYQMQYNLGRDEKTNQDLIVDAVIFVKDKILPIDAKFSLENYNRLIKERDKEKRKKLERILKTDLKQRIDETSKYIQPEKKTFEFAFMFIPSEAIYYDLLVGEVGGQGLRSLQIEESVKEIQKNVEKLGRHLIQYDDYLKKLGNHLETTVNAYNNTHKEFQKIDKDILKISGSKRESIDPLSINKPQKELQ